MSAYRVCWVVYRVCWLVYQEFRRLGGTWTLIGEHYIGGVQCQCLTEEVHITQELPYNACHKNYTTPCRLRRSSDSPHKFPRPSNFFRAMAGFLAQRGEQKQRAVLTAFWISCLISPPNWYPSSCTSQDLLKSLQSKIATETSRSSSSFAGGSGHPWARIALLRLWTWGVQVKERSLMQQLTESRQIAGEIHQYRHVHDKDQTTPDLSDTVHILRLDHN